MDVLIGCGGRIQENHSLKRIAPIGSLKALLPLKEKPMIQWVLDALANVSSIRRLFLIGYEGPSLQCGGKTIFYLKDMGGIMENLFQGIQKVLEESPSCEKLLWVSSDLPLIKPEMIDWFIREIHASNHDLYYQVIQKSLMENRFSKNRRTHLKLKDKTLCFGDIHALNPQVHFDISIGKQIEKFRKSPFHIAKLLGFLSTLKFIFRMGTEKEITQIVKMRFGVDLKLLDSPYPEMGFDIDKIEDYQIFCSK